MERYEELMQRVCVYVESKIKKIVDAVVYYKEYEICITIDSELIDDFEYKTTPQMLEYCIKDNGCILKLGNDVLEKLQRHINNTFFKFD